MSPRPDDRALNPRQTCGQSRAIRFVEIGTRDDAGGEERVHCDVKECGADWGEPPKGALMDATALRVSAYQDTDEEADCDRADDGVKRSAAPGKKCGWSEEPD